jgi:thiol:disulfide interchange protein DsbG
MNTPSSPYRRHFLLTAAMAGLMLAAACKDKPATAAPAAAAPQPPSTKVAPQEAYSLAAQGSGFAVGPIMAAHTVYVFFDPACPHCAHLWEAAKPLASRLKVVWMPIGLLGRNSAPQGATILSATDPAAAMAQNEASVLERKGGIAVDPALKPEVLAKVQANTELFNKLGADGVPLIVYKNGKTGVFGNVSGAVDTATLAAMAGL